MTSVPSLNVTPATTLGNRFSPFNLRQVLAAAMTSLNTISLAVVGDRAPLVRTVRCRTVAKTNSIGVRGPQVIPVLGGEVEEGEQRITVPGQALGRLRVFRPILLDEDRDGGFGRRSRRRRGDLADVGLHGALNGFRHLVEQVGGLVQPAPLVAGGGQDLVEGLPEAEGAVADRDLGRDGEAAPLHVDQQLPPALGAFPHADLKPDQFLPAFRRGSDEDQHALGLLLHPGLQVDPVGPDVDVAPGRQVPLLPAIVFGLPLGREAPDDRG